MVTGRGRRFWGTTVKTKTHLSNYKFLAYRFMRKLKTAEIKNISAHDVASASSQQKRESLHKNHYLRSEVFSDNNKLLYK